MPLEWVYPGKYLMRQLVTYCDEMHQIEIG